MRTFNAETAAVVVELQQLLMDFGRESDFNNAHNVTDFYAEDGVLFAGGQSYRGHSAIRKFYADRNERVKTEQRDGVRTVRHSFVNVQVLLEDPTHATLNFGSLNYSDGGKPPITGFTGPTLYADCEMKLRRDESGAWLVTHFRGDAVFVGGDSFLNQIVHKNP